MRDAGEGAPWEVGASEFMWGEEAEGRSGGEEVKDVCDAAGRDHLDAVQLLARRFPAIQGAWADEADGCCTALCEC